MTTFGKITKGGSWEVQNNPDRKASSHYQITENGKLTKIYAYIGADAGTGTTNARAGIYENNGGVPGALVGQSTNTLNIGDPGVGQWREFLMSDEVLQGGLEYFLTVQWESSINFWLDAGSSGDSDTNSDTYSDGLADPWGSSTPTSFLYSIYGEYTAVSSGTGIGKINEFNRIKGTGFP